MEEKKKRKISNVILTILILLVFLSGAALLLYPVVSNTMNQYRNIQTADGYGEVLEQLDKAACQSQLQQAREYNAEHRVNQLMDVFQEGQESEAEASYENLLNPSGDGVMGYITIPKIDMLLAIYHGVDQEVLVQGAGHVEGTSLPVGGSGTHSVLAAHRGLPGAKLFTDLDQLEEGDLFYITVLNETLAYEVDQITTVLPDQMDSLAIEEGQDYVTLLTCTPYGVNTHRLLVRGRRTEYTGELDTGVMSVWDIPYMKLLMAGVAAAMLVLLLVLIRIGRRRRTGSYEKN